MKYSDSVKTILLAAIDELAADTEKYAKRPSSTDAPSKAALYKQLQKLKDGALRCLLPTFNRKLKNNLFNAKYQLIACDGSSLDIFRSPGDPDTFFEANSKSPKSYNQTYINACYSILDRRFTDLVIQPGRKRNEYSAFCRMVDAADHRSLAIYLCDRGYASYNNFAHHSFVQLYQ